MGQITMYRYLLTLLVCVLVTGTGSLPAKNHVDAIDEETDGDKTQEIIGSSVVTSISVIMDGNEPQFTDAIGKPMPKPVKPMQVASPINLLNPDRYEFFTFNKNGELVKKLMTMKEIQSIVASGDHEGAMLLHSEPIKETNSTKVQEVLNNVQKVLNGEQKKNVSVDNFVLDTPDVSSSWDMILPAIFGNTGDVIKPAIKPIKVDMPVESDFVEVTKKPVDVKKPTTSAPEVKITPKVPHKTTTPIVISTTLSTSTNRIEPSSSSSIATTESSTEKISQMSSSIGNRITTVSNTQSMPSSTIQSVTHKTDGVTTSSRPEIIVKTTEANENTSNEHFTSATIHSTTVTSSKPAIGTNLPPPSIDNEYTDPSALMDLLTTLAHQMATEKVETNPVTSQETITESVPLDDSTINDSTEDRNQYTTILSSEDSTESMTTNKPDLSMTEHEKLVTSDYNLNTSQDEETDVTTSDPSIHSLIDNFISENLKNAMDYEQTTVSIATFDPIINDKINVMMQKNQSMVDYLKAAATIASNLHNIEDNDDSTTTQADNISDMQDSFSSIISQFNAETELPIDLLRDGIKPEIKPETRLEDTTIMESERVTVISAPQMVHTVKPIIDMNNEDLTLEEYVNSHENGFKIPIDVTTDAPTDVTKDEVTTISNDNDVKYVMSVVKEVSSVSVKKGEPLPLENKKVTNTSNSDILNNTVQAETTEIPELLTTEFAKEEPSTIIPDAIEKLGEKDLINDKSKFKISFKNEDDGSTEKSDVVSETTAMDEISNETTIKDDPIFETTIKQEPMVETTIRDENILETTVKDEQLFETTIQNEPLFVTTIKDEEPATSTEIPVKISETTILNEEVALTTISDLPNESPIEETTIVSAIELSTDSVTTMKPLTDIKFDEKFVSNQEITVPSNLATEVASQESVDQTTLNDSTEIIKSSSEISVESESSSSSVSAATIETDSSEALTIATPTDLKLASSTESSIVSSSETDISSPSTESEIASSSSIETEIVSSSSTEENRITQSDEKEKISLTSSTTTTTSASTIMSTETASVVPVYERPNNKDKYQPKRNISRPVYPTKTHKYGQSKKPISFKIENRPSVRIATSTAHLGEDVTEFINLTNELAFSYWKYLSYGELRKDRSAIFSPFGLTSVLSMVFLGARGMTSGEMNELLRLDDMITFNPHSILRNVSDSVEDASGNGLTNSAIIKELFTDVVKGKILSFYKEKVNQFYSGHVEEVGYKKIGDIVRRRTNLLVKRHTHGKILEYLKTNDIVLRPPLAAASVNIFETDCSMASINERDGEMFFQVAPTIRLRKLVPIPAVVYKRGFTAGYDAELDATIAAFGGGEKTVSTILLMPGQHGQLSPGDNLERLEDAVMNTTKPLNQWQRILEQLIDRPGLEIQIPRFSHKSYVNASTMLNQMGLENMFLLEKADFRGLTGASSRDLHLSDIVQVNTFSTCAEHKIGNQHLIEEYPSYINDIDPKPLSKIIQKRDPNASNRNLDEARILEMPLPLRPRQARLPEETPRLKFDRPFLYYVRHNPTGMIIYMGRFNPRVFP